MKFPPTLDRGARVWTRTGFQEHGPIDGLKVNVRGPQGGTIVGSERPYMTTDFLLYVVTWDDGETTKHYEKALLPIGRFATVQEFEAVTKVLGPVEVEAGPRGGFRSATFTVMFDGHRVQDRTYSRDLWVALIEPLVRRDGVEVRETRSK